MRSRLRGHAEVLSRGRRHPPLEEGGRRPRRPHRRRSLSHHQETGRRRHGAGVPGRARPHEAEERGQGHESGHDERSRRHLALQSRGVERQPDQPLERRRHLRFRGDHRRADLSRHGVRGWRAVEPTDRAARRPSRAAGGEHHPADRRCAGRGARSGHRAPRPEARQHHDREEPGRFGLRQGRGLRHRQGLARGRRAEGHKDGIRRRHARVHEPRAAVGGHRGRPQRHLLAGPGRVQHVHGQAALPEQDVAGSNDHAPDRSPAHAAGDEGRRSLACGAAGGDGQGAGQGFGDSLQ